MISAQDFERLSAYLDDELPPRERARLEAQLGQDAELNGALNDLRRQSRALRDLPRVKPPRSFTLTQARAEALRAPRRSIFDRFFPALRLATSLSAAAFAVVLGALTLRVPAAPMVVPAAAPLAAPAAKQMAETAPPPAADSAASAPAAALLAATPAAETFTVEAATGLAAPAATQQVFMPSVAGGVGAPPPEAAVMAPDPLPAWAAGLGLLTLLLAVATGRGWRR